MRSLFSPLICIIVVLDLLKYISYSLDSQIQDVNLVRLYNQPHRVGPPGTVLYLRPRNSYF